MIDLHFVQALALPREAATLDRKLGGLEEQK